MGWRDFTGMSDLVKPILALPNHWIDIPGKKENQTGSKKFKKLVKTKCQYCTIENHYSHFDVPVMYYGKPLLTH